MIFERALDLLIEQVKKERFATGRKARQASNEDADASSCSRHIPDAVKREVFERDGGRCTFRDERGRRCAETGTLEFDHQEGFARTHLHRADRIRLLSSRPARGGRSEMAFSPLRRLTSNRDPVGSCSDDEARRIAALELGPAH